MMARDFKPGPLLAIAGTIACDRRTFLAWAAASAWRSRPSLPSSALLGACGPWMGVLEQGLKLCTSAAAGASGSACACAPWDEGHARLIQPCHNKTAQPLKTAAGVLQCPADRAGEWAFALAAAAAGATAGGHRRLLNLIALQSGRCMHTFGRIRGMGRHSTRQQIKYKGVRDLNRARRNTRRVKRRAKKSRESGPLEVKRVGALSIHGWPRAQAGAGGIVQSSLKPPACCKRRRTGTCGTCAGRREGARRGGTGRGKFSSLHHISTTMQQRPQ